MRLQCAVVATLLICTSWTSAQQLASADQEHHAIVFGGAAERELALSLGARAMRGPSETHYVVATQAVLELMAQQGLRVREVPATYQLGLARGTVDARDNLLLPEHLLQGEVSPAIVSLDGPWESDWIDRIEERGLQFVSLVPPYSALVRGSADSVFALADLPFVLALSPYRPEWRLSERLVNGGAGDQVVTIVGFPESEFSRVLGVVADMGTVLASTIVDTSPRLKALLPGSLLPELAMLPEVRWLDIAPSGMTYNEKMRVIMQTERTWTSSPTANLDFYNPVYGIGVYGEGQLVVVTDDGVRATHDAFQQNNPSKLLAHYVPPGLDPLCGGMFPVSATLDDPGNHGTHVVGSVAGNDAGTTGFMSPNLYDGLAFRSQVIMQAIGGPNAEFCVPDPYVDLLLKTPYNRDPRARIHTCSWGHGPIPIGATSGSGMPGTQMEGTYSQISQDLDAFLLANPDAVQIFAAGNFGTSWADGTTYVPGSISDDGHAKNVITVGGVMNGDSRHTMYLYSSNGPTNDGAAGGRVKPDLVAPGQFLVSSENASDSDYGAMWSGTSFSAPVIAGAAALVRDYFSQGFYPTDASDPPLPLLPYTSSALIKAMLINSTVWVQSASGYTSCSGTSFPGSCYPNYDQGFGRPALDTVLEPAGYRQLKVWENLTTDLEVGELWSTTLNLKDIWQAGCTNLRVTLVWTDPPGDAAVSPKLVNDLDLVVTINPNSATNAITLLGNEGLNGAGVADHLNNVEDVLWTPDPAPLGKTKQVRIDVLGVSGTMTAIDPQSFAVVLTYGPCFDVTPCFGVGGCYAGPGDTVPGSVPTGGGGDGCNGHQYSTEDCVNCGEDPSVDCDPPPPIKPIKPVKPVPKDP